MWIYIVHFRPLAGNRGKGFVRSERRQFGGGAGGGVGRGGFTLFELVLVVLVLGIVAAMLVPMVGSNYAASRLPTAANVLASDIEYCASACITSPGEPVELVIDVPGNSYLLRYSKNGTTLMHPMDGMPWVNDLSSGRNARLSGVVLSRVVEGSGTRTVLSFDAYGRPQISADLVITLALNEGELAVLVRQETGDVSVGAVDASVALADANLRAAKNGPPTSDGVLKDNGKNVDVGVGLKNGVDNLTNK